MNMLVNGSASLRDIVMMDEILRVMRVTDHHVRLVEVRKAVHCCGHVLDLVRVVLVGVVTELDVGAEDNHLFLLVLHKGKV